jgi:GNAT superfamily N-acetyltransferase
MAELRPAMAEHLAALTPERGEALGLRTWRGRLVADARYMRTAPDEAEVAILVADAYQGRGLGKALLGVLFERAQVAGVNRLTAEVLTSNDAIVHVLESLVPVETVGYETGARCLRMPLNEVAAAA